LATSEMQIAASDGSISYPTVSTRRAGLSLEPKVSLSARDPSEYAVAYAFAIRPQADALCVGRREVNSRNGISHLRLARAGAERRRRAASRTTTPSPAQSGSVSPPVRRNAVRSPTAASRDANLKAATTREGGGACVLAWAPVKARARARARATVRCRRAPAPTRPCPTLNHRCPRDCSPVRPATAAGQASAGSDGTALRDRPDALSSLARLWLGRFGCATAYGREGLELRYALLDDGVPDLRRKQP
jgi:hypothetical protein